MQNNDQNLIENTEQRFTVELNEPVFNPILNAELGALEFAYPKAKQMVELINETTREYDPNIPGQIGTITQNMVIATCRSSMTPDIFKAMEHNTTTKMWASYREAIIKRKGSIIEEDKKTFVIQLFEPLEPEKDDQEYVRIIHFRKPSSAADTVMINNLIGNPQGTLLYQLILKLWSKDNPLNPSASQHLSSPDFNTLSDFLGPLTGL